MGESLASSTATDRSRPRGVVAQALARSASLVAMMSLVACAPAKPAETPSAAVAAGEIPAPAPATLGPLLRLGPVADGAIGPHVIDDGERSAMLLAQPTSTGTYRVDLALETSGPPVVRAIAETQQAPRGFALAMTPEGGVAAWIEGDKRATVVAVALAQDGSPLGAPRVLPQGRVEPYWVATRMVDGRRVVLVAEQDAAGATIRARVLADDGSPASAPTTLVRRALAWGSIQDAALVVIRDDAGGARVDVVDVDARGSGKLRSSVKLEGVASRHVVRVDAAGAGADLVVAVSVSEPRGTVMFFRAAAAVASKVGVVEGRVVAATTDAGAPAFVLTKPFPTLDGFDDLTLAVLDGERVRESLLPERLPRAPASTPGLPPSLTRTSEGAFAIALGSDAPRPTALAIDAEGRVERRVSASGVGAGWNLRRRAGALRMTRFEARTSGIDVVDGPFAIERSDELAPAIVEASDVRTHFATPSARIASALAAGASHVLRLEPSVERAGDGDLNAQSLRLVAIRPRGESKDDRLTDRAQPTGSIHVAASKESDAVVTAWLAREQGVQQAHALVLDTATCKAPPCDAWPLARRKHRQITKAGGDVTEVAVIPTPEGFFGAWVEQAGREAAVVAATFDKNLERTSRFERVSALGSQATDLVLTLRGSGVWLAWVEGKGSTVDQPRAVPTVARVAMHDARIELKPLALSRTDGLAGALALANHAAGVLAVYIEREGDSAARVADEAEGANAFLTMLLLDERGVALGESLQRGADGEGIPCDVALSSGTLAIERCRPAAFSLELVTFTASTDGVTLGEARTAVRGLRPATQDRPLALDDARVLWLQNDEAGDPWLRSLPLGPAQGRASTQK
jgi:hypothetical protein